MSDRNWPHRGDLSTLRRRYLTGDKTALTEALLYLRMEKKQIIPRWVLDGVLSQLIQDELNEKNSQIFLEFKQLARKQPKERIDQECYFVVEELRGAGVKWDEIFHRAAEKLKRHFPASTEHQKLKAAEKVKNRWRKIFNKYRHANAPRLPLVSGAGSWFFALYGPEGTTPRILTGKKDQPFPAEAALLFNRKDDSCK